MQQFCDSHLHILVKVLLLLLHPFNSLFQVNPGKPAPER